MYLAPRTCHTLCYYYSLSPSTGCASHVPSAANHNYIHRVHVGCTLGYSISFLTGCTSEAPCATQCHRSQGARRLQPRLPMITTHRVHFRCSLRYESSLLVGAQRMHLRLITITTHIRCTFGTHSVRPPLHTNTTGRAHVCCTQAPRLHSLSPLPGCTSDAPPPSNR